jgi:hypothetical protein
MASSLIARGLSSLLLAVSFTPVALASEGYDFSNYWTDAEAQKEGIASDEVLLSYNENGAFTGRTSYIEALDGKTNAGLSLCAEIGEGPCDVNLLLKKKIAIYAPLVMPFCADESDGDCVESLTLVAADGTKVVAEFIRAVEGPTFKAKSKFKLPDTGTQLLFRAPGILNAAGTDTYAVEYTQTLAWVGKTTPIYGDLKVAVTPYAEAEDAGAQTQKLVSGKSPAGIGEFTNEPWNMPLGAIWMEDGLLGKMANFEAGVGAYVSIRAHTGFGGWFRGRLSSAEFEASKLSATQQRIRIGGTSVEIPRLVGIVNKAQYQKYTNAPMFFFENHKGGGIGGDVSDPEGIFMWLDAIRAATKDKAAGLHRSWMFASVPILVNQGCYKTSGVQGMVATNAAVYAGGAPKYSGGFLNYKVGGLHYLPDGSEAIGTYDLVMRADIARCLYGFSKAPVSGTVTVSGDGDTNIATTTVGEKNGWLKLSANGFTFSTKTIKVKLTQKKSTITCVTTAKPTKTKKVTGLAPKCPTGYKKK